MTNHQQASSYVALCTSQKKKTSAVLTQQKLQTRIFTYLPNEIDSHFSNLLSNAVAQTNPASKDVSDLALTTKT